MDTLRVIWMVGHGLLLRVMSAPDLMTERERGGRHAKIRSAECVSAELQWPCSAEVLFLPQQTLSYFLFLAPPVWVPE